MLLHQDEKSAATRDAAIWCHIEHKRVGILLFNSIAIQFQFSMWHVGYMYMYIRGVYYM